MGFRKPGPHQPIVFSPLFARPAPAVEGFLARDSFQYSPIFQVSLTATRWKHVGDGAASDHNFVDVPGEGRVKFRNMPCLETVEEFNTRKRIGMNEASVVERGVQENLAEKQIEPIVELRWKGHVEVWESEWGGARWVWD